MKQGTTELKETPHNMTMNTIIIITLNNMTMIQNTMEN